MSAIISTISELNMDDTKGDDVDASSYSSILTVEASKKILKDAMKKENQPGFIDFDGVSCVDCGDDLIEFRRKNDFIRCVDCQEMLEHKQKLHA